MEDYDADMQKAIRAQIKSGTDAENFWLFFVVLLQWAVLAISVCIRIMQKRIRWIIRILPSLRGTVP